MIAAPFKSPLLTRTAISARPKRLTPLLTQNRVVRKSPKKPDPAVLAAIRAAYRPFAARHTIEFVETPILGTFSGAYYGLL